MKKIFEFSSPDLDDLAKKYNIERPKIEKMLLTAQSTLEPVRKVFQVVEDGNPQIIQVTRNGVGPLVTADGPVWQYDFILNDRWEKYSVLVSAKIDLETFQPIFDLNEELHIRTDSGCETGQIFNDMTCDCLEQLRIGSSEVAKNQGILIYIPNQDGRGMGLPFKLATLFLQEGLGVDTVESASLLASGGLIDVRTYSGVIAIMKFFEVPVSVRLNFHSNNPHKREVFKSNGYSITTQTNVIVEPNSHTERHLNAKKKHLGHELE